MNKEKAIQIGEQIKKVLEKNKFDKMLPEYFYQNEPYHFDFSVNNPEMSGLDMSTPEAFINYIKNTLSSSGRIWGLGGYGEKRDFYQASSNFVASKEARDIHLGLDIWVPEGTEIFAPISGIVHSFQDNNKFLDYGPTIIVEHNIDGIIFYTLYGHLSRESLAHLHEGMVINAGDKLCEVGEKNVNGSWPSHLHFQIIGDMMDWKGDFPGVASTNDSDIYLNLCSNPELIFKI